MIKHIKSLTANLETDIENYVSKLDDEKKHKLLEQSYRSLKSLDWNKEFEQLKHTAYRFTINKINETYVKKVNTDLTHSFSEKYRPQNLDECILPSRVRNILEKWILNQNCHFIFKGSAGSGKTSTALAISKQVSPDNYSIINASEFNSVDDIKNQVIARMRTMSLLSDDKRIIILDESDELTEKSQTVLRRPLEEFSRTTSVIFTYNNDKIIEPLKSRCLMIDFDFKSKKEIEEMKLEIEKRIKSIVNKEKLKISNGDILNLIEQNYPDIRAMLKELEFIVT